MTLFFKIYLKIGKLGMNIEFQYYVKQAKKIYKGLLRNRDPKKVVFFNDPDFTKRFKKLAAQLDLQPKDDD